ncbi:MAG UNVERIFIED_CONTAM: hypothetical protein LVR29_33295 [Microcystis novacekii LVE1205-3]
MEWKLYSRTSTGKRPELEGYFPLPEILVPIQLSAGLLAFYATSQGANPK